MFLGLVLLTYSSSLIPSSYSLWIMTSLMDGIFFVFVLVCLCCLMGGYGPFMVPFWFYWGGAFES